MSVDDGSVWFAFDQVPDQPDDVALVAAKSDIETQRRKLLGGAAPALLLESWVRVDDSQLVVRVAGPDGAGSQETRLPRAVIEHSAKAKVSPLTLLGCALAVHEPLDVAWRPHRVGTTSPPTGATLERHLRIYRRTEADDQIERALLDGRDVILMGDYGAGKTATGTVHARRCTEDGYGVVWLDLTDPADGPQSVLVAMLGSPRHDRYLVFVDSVQANPAAFEEVQTCVRTLRSEFALKVQVLATAWPRLVQGWREPFKEFRKVTAQNDAMIRGLVADSAVPVDLSDRIIQLAGGDVHLAVDAIDFHERHGRVPTWSDLQGEFTVDIEDDECRKGLYWFAALGFFGLDASAQVARGRLSERALERLVERGLISYYDGRYAIPSHARARLALRRALAHWDAVARWGPPERLIWEHLQRGGRRLIRATLGRLDLVGVSGDQSAPFNESTRYLARAWDLFEQLGRALAFQCSEDATWGDNVGAAIFAAWALSVMDHDEAWRNVAAFIRDRWKYDVPGKLPTPAGKASAESDDFDQILARMRQEDEETPDAPHVLAYPADTIDMGRFYKMWMLGALLGFEGNAIHSDQQRLTALLATAKEKIHPAGYFYPRRVPWVTARIVLGLCLAGESYDSSDVVRSACDWLRRSVNDGGAFNNRWHSGTGTWNTSEATTAMCLTALLRAGAPTTETSIGLAWLKTREGDWALANREVDLALVLEAMLLGNDYQTVYQRVLDLLAWVQDQLASPTLPMPESVPEVGPRAPFVAAQLASFVWATVIREYKALFRALIENDRRDQPASSHADATTPDVSAERRSAEETDPAAGDDLVEPRPSLSAWRRALRQLDERLLSHLQSRDNILRHTRHGGAPEVHAWRQPAGEHHTLPVGRGVEVQVGELEHYRGLLKRTRALAEQVRERTDPAVLIELNRIGTEVCGRAWPDLHVPSEHRFAERGTWPRPPAAAPVSPALPIPVRHPRSLGTKVGAKQLAGFVKAVLASDGDVDAEWARMEVVLARDGNRLTDRGAFERVVNLASGVWGTDIIPVWLASPNSFLDFATPIDALLKGNVLDVLAALRSEASGVYA
jgi:hypothetical protein